MEADLSARLTNDDTSQYCSCGDGSDHLGRGLDADAEALSEAQAALDGFGRLLQSAIAASVRS